MGVLKGLKARLARNDGDSDRLSDTETPAVTNASPIDDGENAIGKAHQDGDIDDTLPNQELTEGVRDIEAITLVWTKRSLITLFICIWFVYLLNAFQGATVGNFIPYVTSSFGEHSLLTVIDVIASSMTAAVFIPLAKLLDLWGRAEGFLVMVAFADLGLILMATSKTLPVYCAANVSDLATVQIKSKSLAANSELLRYSTKLVSPVSSTASTL